MCEPVAVSITVTQTRDATFALSPEALFAFVRKVPNWAPLFPRVETVEPLGGEVYLWHMEPIGPPGYAVQTSYACRYAADAEAQRLIWTPADHPDATAAFSGHMQVGEAEGGASLSMAQEATLSLPIPRLARGLVQPAVEAEFERMTARFEERLREAVTP